MDEVMWVIALLIIPVVSGAVMWSVLWVGEVDIEDDEVESK